MPCLSELELLRDLTVSQRVRVEELERQIEAACAGLGAVAKTLTEVRNGVEINLTGILPVASVSIITQAHDVVLKSITREQPRVRTERARERLGHVRAGVQHEGLVGQSQITGRVGAPINPGTTLTNSGSPWGQP